MGGPIHGLLLLVLAPVAAVVVVVVALLRGHALQGILVEVHGVRALRGQRRDRALHGARVRDGLQGQGGTHGVREGVGPARPPGSQQGGVNSERKGQGGQGQKWVTGDNQNGQEGLWDED